MVFIHFTDNRTDIGDLKNSQVISLSSKSIGFEKDFRAAS